MICNMDIVAVKIFKLNLHAANDQNQSLSCSYFLEKVPAFVRVLHNKSDIVNICVLFSPSRRLKRIKTQLTLNGATLSIILYWIVDSGVKQT